MAPPPPGVMGFVCCSSPPPPPPVFLVGRVVVRGVSLGGFRKNDVREAVLFSEEIVLEGAATELGTSSSAAAKKKKKKKSKLPNSSLTTLEVGEYA